MFDYLEGRIVRREPTRIVIEVGSIGYQCQVPLGTAERLAPIDGRVRVFALTVAQEDLPRLLGFATEQERDLCRLLLRVPGIGPSLALGLLSADTPARLLTAIETEDIVWLRRIKGIGPKTAQRICLEIKDRAATWLQAIGGPGATRPPRDAAAQDAVQALVSLGFATAEAETRVAGARGRHPDGTTETLVKDALRGG